MRNGLQRTPGSQILSTGVFTHLIGAASSPYINGSASMQSHWSFMKVC
ncbi:MAG TPA: hypothetical protein VFP20_01045 [Bacteroidales bacterium]|nr:hypothetical protein [Bacteroidales bacterium]